MTFWFTLSLILNAILWFVVHETRKELKSEREMRELAEFKVMAQPAKVVEISPPITASEIVRKKREQEAEVKRKEHGPAPVSWVGKAALLEHLTEDPRFERAQNAHKEII